MTGRNLWGAGVLVLVLVFLAGLIGYQIGRPSQPATVTTPDAATVKTSATNLSVQTPERATPEDGALAYYGATPRQAEGTTSVCLRFSSALDPQRVVDDKAFIRLTPDAPFSLQTDGTSLCLLGLDDETTYTLAILPGLTALDGSELRSQIAESVAFDPKPALVGFVGDGIILPRGEASVLGVKAMNADAVDLTLYRVNHRALFDQSPDVGETTLEGDWSWNSAAWQTRVEVHSQQIDTSGAVNELVERGVALQPILSEQGPGAYIVELERAGAQNSRAANSWRWLYVTDLALAAYRTEQALHVTVRSIETADTVGGVTLMLIARNNDVLGQAEADASGRAVFPAAALRGTGNLAPKMVMAYAGEDDFAALDLARSPLDLTAYDVTGRQASGPVDAFMFTERGIYRPGETVHLTALVRDAQARAAFDRPGTLTVRRPDGTEFSESRVSPSEQAGALIRRIGLPENAARGRWTAELSLDGLDEVGSVRFSVQDFIPEQLRLDLRADDAPIVPGQARAFTIAADFLYGAKGRGLDAEAEARVGVDPNPFPEWSDYTFGNAVETFREQIVPIGQGLTDEDGLFRTDIDVAGEAFQSSSPLRLFVTAGVAEPGGRYVRDSLFLPLRSEAVYVGFDPVFDGGYAKRDSPAEIRLVALDASGARTAVNGTLSLIREDYDYHWYRENGRWRYRRDRRDIVFSERDVAIGADAPVLFSEALDYGEYRLRFTTEAGQVFSYQFGSGWRRAGGDSDAPDRVEIGLDKTDVKPGDTVVLSVNSPFAGMGELVMADREVRTVQTVRIEEGQSEITLPLGRDWTTDLYAMLSVYAPGEDRQARRAVGLVHIPMNRSEQTLTVSLDMPERIRPETEQDVVVQVAGLDGEQAFLALAAVDTGILQITDYTPPSPEDHYFGKLAFPIDLFDDYARMLAPFSGADRVGGDGLGGAGLSVVPTTIVSLFEGPVEVRNGKATVTLDVPAFQGELTVMAVAWSETKLGAASAPMIVRDPVTAQLALPRFLAPGDRAVATVALDNIEGEDGTYALSVSRDGTSVATAEQALAQGERGETPIDIVATGTGIETYALRIDGPGFETERNYQIQTRDPAMPITRTRFVELAPGETATLDFTGDKDGLLSGARTYVSASFSPGLDPQRLLTSLRRYPYGCTEQTVSVASPLLLAGAFGGLPDMSEAQRDATVQSAVDRLLERQDASGAFGLWRRGDGNASPYLQLYAGDFVLAAAEAGYTVPNAARRRTLDSVRALSQLDGGAPLALDYNFGLDDNTPDYELRAAERAAYALALLAEHDTVKKTELLYLADRFGDRLRGSLAHSQLGFALNAVGETEAAQAAFLRASDNLSDTGQTYYATEIRNAAALLALSDDLPDAAATQALLALQVDNPEQLNTHEKAWALRALAGRRVSGVPFADEDGWTPLGSTAGRSVGSDTLEVTNDEASPVWVQVSVTGTPDGSVAARSQGATLSKTIYDLSGRPLPDAALSRGERAVIVVDAEGSGANEAMWVLADLLPAGLEIETVLSSADAGETGPFAWVGAVSDVDLTEARDDRFVASWRSHSRFGSRRKRVAYVVRAVTQGDFVFPGAHMEDMYRPDRMATTASGRFAVTAAPTL